MSELERVSATYMSALRGISETLAADGYRVTAVATADGDANVTISAGPEACEDCLIPKELMVNMLKAELPASVRQINVTYPNDAPPLVAS